MPYPNSEIRFARPEDAQNVRELWDMAFGEDKDFNDWFFENIFNIDDVLLYTIDNKIAAMTQMPAYEIKGLGTLTYIYGAATHPDMRRKGIMSQLLEKSFEIDKQNGRVGSMLIPANKGLFDFYARFGYEKAFYISKKTYKASEFEIKKAEFSDIPLLNNIYENTPVPHPTRTADYWQKQISMFNDLGGGVYLTENAYAFAWEDEIQELMGGGKDKLASALAHKAKLPAIEAATVGTDIPLGVIKLYNGQFDKMYFNLMFN